MLTLFVRGLPPHTTEANLTALFSHYGRVHSMKLNRDLFTGKVRGTALINMEGHEARAAIAGLDGTEFEGNSIYVNLDKSSSGGSRGRR
jgi:RNA recognition motif-containing protein